MRTIALTLMLLPLSTLALAQDGADKRRVQYKERTEIDFDQVDVTATLDGPSVMRVDEILRPEHASFIELRRDFVPELAASVDHVK